MPSSLHADIINEPFAGDLVVAVQDVVKVLDDMVGVRHGVGLDHFRNLDHTCDTAWGCISHFLYHCLHAHLTTVQALAMLGHVNVDMRTISQDCR